MTLQKQRSPPFLTPQHRYGKAPQGTFDAIIWGNDERRPSRGHGLGKVIRLIKGKRVRLGLMVEVERLGATACESVYLLFPFHNPLVAIWISHLLE